MNRIKIPEFGLEGVPLRSAPGYGFEGDVFGVRVDCEGMDVAAMIRGNIDGVKSAVKRVGVIIFDNDADLERDALIDDSDSVVNWHRDYCRVLLLKAARNGVPRSSKTAFAPSDVAEVAFGKMVFGEGEVAEKLRSELGGMTGGTFNVGYFSGVEGRERLNNMLEVVFYDDPVLGKLFFDEIMGQALVMEWKGDINQTVVADDDRLMHARVAPGYYGKRFVEGGAPLYRGLIY